MPLGIGTGIGVRKRSASPPGFSPLDFGGPSVVLFWIDGKTPELCYFSDAGGVVAVTHLDAARVIKDKSGNANTTAQATLANRMTYDATLGELTADGGDRYPAFTFPGGTDAQPFSVAAVWRVDNSLGMLFDNTSPRWLVQRGAAADAMQIHTGTTLTAGSMPAAASVRAGYYLELNGGTSRLFRNNAPIGASGAAGANGAAGFALGGVSSSFPIGGIAELIVFSRLLTSDERTALHTYFAAKWSLS